MRDNSHFLIKGLKEGILITFTDPDLEHSLLALDAHIKTQSAFFTGAKVLLEFGGLELDVNKLSSIRKDLSDKGITLTTIISDNEKTKRSGDLLGLLVNPDPEAKKQNSRAVRSDAPLWHEKTVRSGTKIEHVGNIIIIGDINPGAEVIATGSIIVWGRVKGFIHAGKNGDTNAFISAIELRPTQLRIAGIAATSPNDEDKIEPETVKIVNGQLLAEPWDAK